MMRNSTPTRCEQRRRYTPYGDFSPDGGPWQAFANAHRDQISGCYLLGNGHRAYSPSLMRFSSPDRLSPFGAGGKNGYGYCAGDPVNLVDPSGKAPIDVMARRTSLEGSTLSHHSIGVGDGVGFAVQALFSANGIAGVTNTVVRAMEAIENGSQSSVARVAMVGDFWGYGLSLGTRATTITEMLGSSAPLSVVPPSSIFALVSGGSSALSYAELPGRINQLWQRSPSAGAFASLALRGAARASGLDLLASPAARAGRPLVNALQAGGRVVSSILQNREGVITIRGTRPHTVDEPPL